MASPLEEIKIALKITDANASEVVKKLESSFRGLAKSATQLDTKGISKVRDRVKSFDNAGRKNIETIRGQINAMQSLRSQAEIGSKNSSGSLLLMSINTVRNLRELKDGVVEEAFVDVLVAL